MPRILAALRVDLETRGGIEDVEGFIDGTYVPAKKGARASGAAVPGMQRRSWLSQTAMVFHSLSLLQRDPDTTLLSPIELSTLLLWPHFRHDSSATKRGTADRSKSDSQSNATFN